MIWMAVVGLVLGGLRWLAEMFGWTLAVFRWEYFFQLQVIALFNALLAISLWTALQARRTWGSRLMVCGFATLSVMIIANVLMAAIFQNVGAEAVDICWLYGGQAAFLLATLGPLRMAQNAGEQAAGQDESPFAAADIIASAGQTPPPPDSGR